MSSTYEASALAQADAYEKERRRQAEEKIAQIRAEADAAVQTAVDETGDAVRAEERSFLDAVDTAAVERQVTLGQAREAVARLGLAGSGLDAANQHAAALTATRRTQTARRTRDEAVTALAEALARREEETARRRDAAVLAETQDAEQDALKERNELLEAAYKAQASENAAKIKAEQAEKTAKEAAERSAQRTAASRAETIRQDALKKLLSQGLIQVDVYIDAMQQGWSPEETRRRQVAWTAWRKLSAGFVQTYRKQGYDTMIAMMTKHHITERQLQDLCNELQIDSGRVRASLAAARKGK